MNNFSKKSIIVFSGVVICLSAVAEFLICKCGKLWAYPVLMWMPALAAAAAAVVAIKGSGESFSLKRLFSATGFHVCKFKYVLAGVLIPLVYLLIPYIIYWNMHPERFAYSGVSIIRVLTDCVPVAFVSLFASLLTATGEEIGWRGFLTPALNERIGLNKTLLITGLFWCLWHFPLLIWGGYMEGQSLLYSLIAFVLCIFPVGIICGLLAIESGSMWPCAFLHAAHNNYDQAIFDVITRGDDKLFYVSETGIFTIICAWVIAVIMFLGYKKKSK